MWVHILYRIVDIWSLCLSALALARCLLSFCSSISFCTFVTASIVSLTRCWLRYCPLTLTRNIDDAVDVPRFVLFHVVRTTHAESKIRRKIIIYQHAMPEQPHDLHFNLIDNVRHHHRDGVCILCTVHHNWKTQFCTWMLSLCCQARSSSLHFISFFVCTMCTLNNIISVIRI